MNILLLSSDFYLPYRVLRCAAALGHKVYVLGGGSARRLARSRYCAAYVEIEGGSVESLSLEQLAAVIGQTVSRFEIGMVLPSNHETTRLLVMLKGKLTVAIYPLPDFEKFNILNDKYSFGALCQSLGIAHPHTVLMENVTDIRQALARGELALPFVVKPVDLDAARGVKFIRNEDECRQLSEINYAPILVQAFIVGTDLDATIFMKDGSAVIRQSYYREPKGIVFDQNFALMNQCAAILEALEVDGVFNFDARLETKTGNIYLIECNPRFFHSMDYAMIAGINYVEAGIGAVSTRRTPTTSLDSPIARPRRILWQLALGLRPSELDKRILKHFLADPIPILLYDSLHRVRNWWRKLFSNHRLVFKSRRVKPTNL